ASLLVLVLVAAFGVAWYFAGVAVAVTHTVERTLVADPAGAGAVRLSGGPDADLPGTFGLDWQGGYGGLGPVSGRDGAAVLRPFTPRDGALVPGTPARVDTYAYDGDPRTALGLAFDDVRVPGGLGVLPAWYVPAARSDGTWF